MKQSLHYSFISIAITGDGKSQYILKKLKSISSTAQTVTLTINESFSVADAIKELRVLPLRLGNALYLNFTLLPASVSYYLCNPNCLLSWRGCCVSHVSIGIFTLLLCLYRIPLLNRTSRHMKCWLPGYSASYLICSSWAMLKTLRVDIHSACLKG